MRRRIAPAYVEVLRHPSLRRLLAGFGVSVLGDGISFVGVAVLALRVGAGPHRSLVVGAAVAAFTLPGAAGALALRGWLRRADARTLILIDATARSISLGSIAILRACGALDAATYIALLAVGSLAVSWGFAGRWSLVAALAEPSQRMPANSAMSSLDNLGVIIGPAIAGGLLTIADPGVLLGCDAASYVVLGLAVRGLRSRTEVTAGSGQPGELSGWTFIRRHRQLLALLVLTVFFNFFYGPVEVALPVFVANHHAASVLGLYWSVFGVGAVVGGLTAGTLRRLPLWRAAVVIVVGWGLCLVVFYVTPALTPTLIGFGIGGLLYGPYLALSYTLFQNQTPPHAMTSVFAARSALVVAASPLGTAVGGPLTAVVGARTTLFISGLATIALGVLASPIAVRSRE